jgi:hypothetical protein
MPTFVVAECQQEIVTKYYRYEVEAECEAEAIEKVANGQLDPSPWGEGDEPEYGPCGWAAGTAEGELAADDLRDKALAELEAKLAE